MSGVSDAFAQIVENDQTRSCHPVGETLFSCSSAHMRELERNDQQADRFAAVAQRHHEQTGPPVLAALRIAHHRDRCRNRPGLLLRVR